MFKSNWTPMSQFIDSDNQPGHFWWKYDSHHPHIRIRKKKLTTFSIWSCSLLLSHSLFLSLSLYFSLTQSFFLSFSIFPSQSFFLALLLLIYILSDILQQEKSTRKMQKVDYKVVRKKKQARKKTIFNISIGISSNIYIYIYIYTYNS